MIETDRYELIETGNYIETLNEPIETDQAFDT